MKVVISQSMYFPWVGMLEQIRLADVFIHYDDVQYSKGSFTNRVQVKAPDGTTGWMTVPLSGLKLGDTIDATEIKPSAQWIDKHIALLTASLEGSPYSEKALTLARDVMAQNHRTIAELARASMLELVHYFGIDKTTRFLDSASLGVGGSGSRRVLDLVKAVGGTTYITGHGAKHYLDHDLFEREGVTVEYMDYQKTPYPQPHGAFTPYVTGLDLIACCGRQGIDYLGSKSCDWKDFLDET